MCQLSIIIVNYKTPELTLQCLESLYHYEPDLDFEIIIVDNNSQDGLGEMLKKHYPNAFWIQMGYNAGFSRANNAGWKAAKGEYILALNSDTYLTEAGTLSRCLTTLKQQPKPKETVLGCRLVNEDGSYQETLRLEFPGIMREIRANPIYILLFDRILGKSYQGKKLQKEAHYRTGEAAWINGAFWLFHRQVVDKGLLMDEDFFLYGEDVEWCHRVSKQGYKFFHHHKESLVHLGSASSEGFKPIKNMQVILSDWLYILKQRGYIYFISLLWVVLSTNIIDEILFTLARLRKKELSANERNYSIGMKLIRWHLLKKHAWFLLQNGKSSPKYFDSLNCYEKDKGFSV